MSTTHKPLVVGEVGKTEPTTRSDLRDPSAPIPERPIRIHRGVCGFALEDSGHAHCGQPSVYTFRVKGWPAWRVGNTCPEHALIVRRWDVEYMRTLVVAP